MANIHECSHVFFFNLIISIPYFVWCETIPSYLQICYNTDTILYPMRMTTLVDIIRKIELSPNSVYSPRTLASMLIHKFSVDGIERDPNVVIYNKGIIPFRISGYQRFRNQLLKKQLLPADFYYDENILSLVEKCTLHFMLSSSVDLWERGDEFQICPKLMQQKQWYTGEMFGTKMSSCPIEMGTVWANDQAISANRIISAILAALQPVNIPVERWPQNNTVGLGYMSSLWASTIAGDLAEVVSMQGGSSNSYFGPGGQWNNSIIPTNYFLMTEYTNIAQKNWQFSDSELLGDLDGLMMALEMVKWQSDKNLRLSQMIEIFYKGGFDVNICNREQFYLNEIHKRRSKVEQQTKYFTNELFTICSTCNHQDDNALDSITSTSYEQFNQHAIKLLHRPICPEKAKAMPRIDLNIIFDSTYQPYTKLQLFMMLADKLDTSYYGSRITLINGETGAVVVNRATTSGDLYIDWVNASNYSKDPKYLDVSKSVTSLINNLRKREIENNWRDSLQPVFSHVTLIMGTRSSIQTRDLDAFRIVQRNLLTIYPEQRIFYLTSPINYETFNTLGGFYRDRKRNQAITFDPNKPKEEIQKILKPILSVRRELKPDTCQGKQSKSVITNYYEVITPHYTYQYIIEPEYLCQSNSTVKIRLINGGNGDVEMCLYRRENSGLHHICKTSTLNNKETITLYNPCDRWDPTNNANCQPIFLDIRSEHSLLNCGDETCRSPDQIKVNLQVEGLQCISDITQNCNFAYKLCKINVMYLIILQLIIKYVTSQIYNN